MKRLLLAAVMTVLSATACSPSLAPPTGAWTRLPTPPVAQMGATVLPIIGGILVLGGTVPGDTGGGTAGTAQPGGPFAGPVSPARPQRARPSTTVLVFGHGLWTRLRDMPEPVSQFGAAMLADGDVLVAGGAGARTTPSRSAWVLNPRNGAWRRVADMHEGRVAPAIILLREGQALVAGGATGLIGDDPPPSAMASAELFDPATGRWAEVPAMHHGRVQQSATLLPSGLVLIAGGEDAGTPLASAEFFDPRNVGWSLAPDMPQARYGHVAALDGGSVVLISGSATTISGGAFALNPSLNAEVFDYRSRNWALGSPPDSAGLLIAFEGAARLADARFLLLAQGGAAYSYDPSTDYWSAAAHPPVFASAPTLVASSEGRAFLLIAGSAWEFDPTSSPPDERSPGGFGSASTTATLAAIAGIIFLLIGWQAALLWRRAESR
jgi:hypothetical protein